jgi:UDP-N-acetylmuramate dehydrogenase
MLRVVHFAVRSAVAGGPVPQTTSDTADVTEIVSDRLSTLRTRHRFKSFAEFTEVDQFIAYRAWARERRLALYILANGSNTLFVRRNIRTLVLRNCLAPWMKDLGNGRIEASSSLPLITILRYCEKNSLDSFYYLASVPAQVGGAIAMNAGGGVQTIFDFLESVTFVEDERFVTLRAEEIEHRHRWTIFTGVHDRLIVSAIFQFPRRHLEESEIRKRIAWCHAHQDLSAPNCGSVFREYYPPIVKWVRGLPPGGVRWPILQAQFSRKVNNWIICKSRSSWSIVLLIRGVQLIHRLFGKRAVLELIEVH